MEDLAEEPQMDSQARMVHAATTWMQQDQVATGVVCTVIRVIDTSVELGRPLVTTVRNLGTMLGFVFQNSLNLNLNPQEMFMMTLKTKNMIWKMRLKD